MKTFWLSTHAGYACRHSGACCTARWPIPIEVGRAGQLARAVEQGAVTPAVQPWLNATGDDAPPEVAGILAHQPSGACVFFRPGHPEGGCAVHASRPMACEHFPLVSVTDPRGVHITLSHYCPTAAGLLFTDAAPVDVVEGPPVLAGTPEGLDAREALPPAQTLKGMDDADGGMRRGGRPRVARRHGSVGPRLMSWDEVTAWERRLVRTLAADRAVPGPPDRRVFDQARSAVPAPWSWPAASEGVEELWTRSVAPSWEGWSGVVGRYLAAKAHGSWALHIGRGLEDVRRAVDVARVVLQVEAARACGPFASSAGFDRARLATAIRQADLLLVHYADPRRLFAPAA